LKPTCSWHSKPMVTDVKPRREAGTAKWRGETFLDWPDRMRVRGFPCGALCTGDLCRRRLFMCVGPPAVGALPVQAWPSQAGGGPARRSGYLRHTVLSAEGCCRQALTRFTEPRCARPDRRAQPPRAGPRRRLQASLSGAGGVRERPNRHDWKSCVGQPTVGSNPTLSASQPTSQPASGCNRHGISAGWLAVTVTLAHRPIWFSLRRCSSARRHVLGA
jgi:hypothetical protein